MDSTTTATECALQEQPTHTLLPAWKRAIDILAGVAALPVLAPLMLVMFILTRLFSPGPILFRQERVGYNGHRFTCFKFRTMKLNASTSSHQQHCQDLIRSNRPMVKLDSQGDPRLIPGGWLLRASGLDELPQMLNVLRGEMSLVGPRPCLPFEYELYLPWQRERFSTLPGLTGLWQVNGKNKTTFDEMIRLDIKYARTKSFGMDLTIIFKTLPALIVQVRESREASKEATFPQGASAGVPARSVSR